MKKLIGKWWFWVIVIAVIIGIGNSAEPDKTIKTDEPVSAAEVEEPAPSVEPEPEPTVETATPPEPESTPLTPQETIVAAVETIVADLKTTTLHDVKVSDHAGTDNPDDYIVLVYLSFDAKNFAKTAKRMLNLYNNEVGARLADVPEISEITIFWEVPFLREGENVAKANLTRHGEGMAFEGVWYDGRIFE